MSNILFNKFPVEVVNEVESLFTRSEINARQENQNAFFIGDLGDIVCKYQVWIDRLPRVHPYYAVKCDYEPVVLRLLAELGAGFDCASMEEIEEILDLGVPTSRIIFANPCKQQSHIEYAEHRHVHLMTFDNEEELHKVKAVHPDAKMVVRILPPIFNKCKFNLGNKFGCKLNHVAALLRVAKQLDIEVVGVSFHVGSSCYDVTAFSSAVAAARSVFDIAEQLNFHFDLLDIGGGFPGHHTDILTFDDIVYELGSALDRCFPKTMSVRIIAEPGRYFVASSYTLIVNIIALRTETADDNDNITDSASDAQVSLDSESTSFMYYINDGKFGTFSIFFCDTEEPHVSLVEPDLYADMRTYVSSVWGPTCAGNDQLIKKCHLPRLNIGDWLLFRNLGAYSLSLGCCFNGMPRPKVHYVITQKYWNQLTYGEESMVCNIAKLKLNEDNDEKIYQTPHQ